VDKLSRGLRLAPIALAGALFVFLPTLAGLAGEHARPLENKPLADPPSLTAGWDVFDEASAFVQDHLPVRNAAVDLHGKVVSKAFGDPPLAPTQTAGGVAYPSVVDGENGWMYYGADFLHPCNPELPVDRTVDRLTRLATILRGAGKQVAIVVVPDKSSVVVDELPSRYIGRKCSQERKQQFWSAYAGHDPDFLDLRPALAAADRVPGRAYLKTDSHWTPAGSVAYAKSLVDHLSAGTWSAKDLRRGGTFRKHGDLATVLLEDTVDEVPNVSVHRDGVTPTHESRSGNYTFRYRNTSPEPTALVRGRTSLIGDSFTYTSRETWSPWFENVTTRHRANTATSLVLGDLAASSNVIFEVVERDAASGSLGSVNDAFLNELEERLAKKS